MDITADLVRQPHRRRPQPINNFSKPLLSLKTATAFLAAQVAASKASSFLPGKIQHAGERKKNGGCPTLDF
jgi:hypothetical protein